MTESFDIRKMVAENEKQRLDVFLAEQNSDLSRSYIRKLIMGENATVNEKTVKKAGLTIKAGDKVTLKIPPPKSLDIIPEKIDLDIIYEDQNVLLINKPAGMVVHPSAGHDTGTLVHAVAGYLPELNVINDTERPGVVHRLDKNTSGLIIFAKTEEALHFLQNQFSERLVEKHYLALVDGHPKTSQGRIETFIGRDLRQRKKMAVVPQRMGKHAISEYITIAKYENHALLDVRIYTGRTHQIRVHMAFIDSPISGDSIYGRKKSTIPINRHFLHANRLKLMIPGKEEISEFEVPLPKKLQYVIDKLGEQIT